MILEHKGYSIEAFATPTMTWSEAEQEKYRLLGPYESFNVGTMRKRGSLYRRVELIESAPE